jgi:hypothetical protein
MLGWVMLVGSIQVRAVLFLLGTVRLAWVGLG